MSCQRIDPKEFHSREQRHYTNQCVAMLENSVEYQRYVDTEDQSGYLRMNSWLIGIMFVICQLWLDFVTSLSLNKPFALGFACIYFSGNWLFAVASLLLLYPIGCCLMAPWNGSILSRPEDTTLFRIVLAHVIAAFVVAVQPWKRRIYHYPQSDYEDMHLFDTSSPLDVQAGTSAASVMAAVTSIVPALMPLIIGIPFSLKFHKSRWRNRFVLSSPVLVLAPFFTVFSLGLWVYSASALRTNHSITLMIPTMGQRVVEHVGALVFFVASNPFTAVSRALVLLKSQAVIGWLSVMYVEASIYASVLLASATFCGVLEGFVPLVVAIVCPRNRLLWFIYVIALSLSMGYIIMNTTTMPKIYCAPPSLYLAFLFYNFPTDD